MRERTIPAILWALALGAIFVWSAFDRPGWDLIVIYNAMDEVAAKRDPYADGVMQLVRYHDEMQRTAALEPPFIYVYPPITLPVLRAVNHLPVRTSHTLYWIAYVASTLALLWTGMQFVKPDERPYFAMVAPLAVFFPGLLVNGTVLSGNIATILYAAIILSAVRGWRRGSWHWFYFVVWIASCVKGPFLLFALLPALCIRRQWIQTSLTLAAGAATLCLQALIWPVLFSNYLQAIDLMFRYSHDFGCSPAGLLGNFLSAHGISYTPASSVFYALYAAPLCVALFYLSKQYLSSKVSLKEWVPVMLVGLTLLNPRIIEYDVAPITIPLALIGWRFCRSFTSAKNAAAILLLLFVAINAAASHSWETRKLIDGPLIVLLFGLGCWSLMKNSRSLPGQRQESISSLSTEPIGAGT